MKYSLMSAAVAAGAFFCPQLAHADCTFRYQSKLAEIAGEAKLEMASRTAQNIADQLASGLGESKSSKAVTIKAGYAISAAGGLAQDAYSETVRSFFTCAREKLQADPVKVKALDNAEKDFILTLDRYFDIGRWQPENTEERDAIRDQLAEETAGIPHFSAAEIDKILPNPNFDTVKITTLLANASIPGVNLEACGGFMTRSMRKIDPSILAKLGTIRATVLTFLTGDQSSAKLDLWIFAGSQMSRQMTASQVEERIPAVTPALVKCVQDQAKDLQDALVKSETPQQQSPQPAPNAA